MLSAKPDEYQIFGGIIIGMSSTIILYWFRSLGRRGWEWEWGLAGGMPQPNPIQWRLSLPNDAFTIRPEWTKQTCILPCVIFIYIYISYFYIFSASLNVFSCISAVMVYTGYDENISEISHDTSNFHGKHLNETHSENAFLLCVSLIVNIIWIKLSQWFPCWYH